MGGVPVEHENVMPGLHRASWVWDTSDPLYGIGKVYPTWVPGALYPFRDGHQCVVHLESVGTCYRGTRSVHLGTRSVENLCSGDPFRHRAGMMHT